MRVSRAAPMTCRTPGSVRRNATIARCLRPKAFQYQRPTTRSTTRTHSRRTTGTRKAIGKQDQQEMQVDLAGDQHRHNGELPGQVQSEPAIAQRGRERLEPARPALRPRDAALAQDHAATVAQPHAHDEGTEARQPPPADSLGQQRDHSAGRARGAVGGEGDRVPQEAGGSGDDVEAGEIVDCEEHAQGKHEKRRVPAAACGEASLIACRGKSSPRPGAVFSRQDRGSA